MHWVRADFSMPNQRLRAEALDELMARLRRDGIVLLEGLEPRVETFEDVTNALGETFVLHPEIMRDSLGRDGTTQTVTYGNQAIPLHAERAFLPNRPKTLYFMCMVPPHAGGETLVCDGAKVVQSLPMDLARFVLSHRVLYDYVARPALWQRAFQTDDKRVACTKLDALVTTLASDEAFCYRFESDLLKWTYVVPLASPTRFGDTALANSFFYLAPLRKPELWEEYLAGTLPLNLTYPGQITRIAMEDGTPFSREAAEEIHRVATQLTAEVTWRVGDLLIIDNTRFMHGRKSFDDPARRILVRMSTVGTGI